MDELWEMSAAKLAASLRTSAVSIIVSVGGGGGGFQQSVHGRTVGNVCGQACRITQNKCCEYNNTQGGGGGSTGRTWTNCGKCLWPSLPCH